MRKYNFDEVINRKETNCIKWDGQDGDYLPMWVADMDFKCPSAILEAMDKQIKHGIFGYTENEWQLNDVVVNYYKKNYDYEIDPEWIVWVSSVMVGANLGCRLGGGTILYNVPMYNHIRVLGKETHKEIIEVALKKEEDLFYTYDWEALEKAVTPETTTFVLCNPHNPVGRVYTQEELEGVSSFCKKHNLLLISDEIHSQIILEGKHIPAFMISEEAKLNSITLCSAGKTYNIPALPTAFAIIPNPQIREAYKDKINGLVPSANPMTIAAIKAAYTECDDWREELLIYLRGNRDYLERWVATMQGIKVTHIQGTYLAWLDLSNLIEAHPDTFSHPWEYFREKAGVNFSDGLEYYQKEYLRVNLGCTRAQLVEVLDRVKKAIELL